jgi:hypothetical protein
MFARVLSRSFRVAVAAVAGAALLVGASLPAEYDTALANAPVGCTPGYWKNHPQSFYYWAPNTSFNAAFQASFRGVPDQTLMLALGNGGGGISALRRHAAAAMLNSSRFSGWYDNQLLNQQVRELYNAAVSSGDPALIESTTDYFESLNQQGCPLN